ncbi:hypothetical protein O0544_20890 [Edwardsiella anguillarum]|nr:hypothetical protein [Edwardsiella anguillarum]
MQLWNGLLHLSWGEGEKSSSPRSGSKVKGNVYLVALALPLMAGNTYALDVNGYTDFNSSTTISDGLQWNTTATVQVDAGADVVVSNPLDSLTLNMAPAGGGNTSLWINGEH